MSRNLTPILAAGVALAMVVPAYAGGKGSSGSSHGGSYHGSSHGYGYYNSGHYYHYGYRYYGAWPYGYFVYDPAVAVVPDVFSDGPVASNTYQRDYPPPPPVPNSMPAVVRIRTAAGAKMWFDGSATTQTGEQRTFTTPPLDGGKSYSYGVRACWLEDGRPVVRSQTITVAAGKTIEVDLR
jgi:uncharacterized protein (TIGR03000 family)